MAAEDEGLPTTIGELGRLMRTLAKEVREDRRSYLAVQVWEVEKRAIEERDRVKGREIGQLRQTIEGMDAEKEREHKELNDKILAQREEIRKANDQARKDRGKVWLAIGLSLLGGLVAVISSVAVSTLNQVINGFAGG